MRPPITAKPGIYHIETSMLAKRMSCWLRSSLISHPDGIEAKKKSPGTSPNVTGLLTDGPRVFKPFSERDRYRPVTEERKAQANCNWKRNMEAFRLRRKPCHLDQAIGFKTISFYRLWPCAVSSVAVPLKPAPPAPPPPIPPCPLPPESAPF